MATVPRLVARAHGPLPIALTTVLLSTSPALAQTILTWSLEPVSPTTGDPVRLQARVDLPQDCGWEVQAAIRFGAQPEFPAPGWGLDLRAQPTVTPCVPSPIEVLADLDLGTLPVAGGSAVLRLVVDGVVVDRRFFTLSVAAGPAAGWEQPAFHGGYTLLVQSAALTSMPGRLALGDNMSRRIRLLKPETGQEIASLPSPGSGDVRGLAWDGDALYASVRTGTGARIYHLDLLGRVLDSFPAPTIAPVNAPLEGLAFHDGVLYGSLDGPPYLFAMNPTTGQKLWQRPLPVRLPALDAAPSGLLGVEPGGLVYLIEPSESGEDVLLADVADNGLAEGSDLQGLAYDGFGMFVWDAFASEVRRLRPYAVWWALDGTLRVYAPPGAGPVDLLRGPMNELTWLSGNVGLGGAVCQAADVVGGVVPDGGDPPPGEAWYYVARFRTAAGWDSSYGRSSNGFRRFDTTDACP